MRNNMLLFHQELAKTYDKTGRKTENGGNIRLKEQMEVSMKTLIHRALTDDNRKENL